MRLSPPEPDPPPPPPAPLIPGAAPQPATSRAANPVAASAIGRERRHLDVVKAPMADSLVSGLRVSRAGPSGTRCPGRRPRRRGRSHMAPASVWGTAVAANLADDGRGPAVRRRRTTPDVAVTRG